MPKQSIRSPWQSPYVNRATDPIRRKCVDHIVVLGERNLRPILPEHVANYNNTRTHLSLDMNTPKHRETQRKECGKVESFKRVDGLHHKYFRIAA